MMISKNSPIAPQEKGDSETPKSVVGRRGVLVVACLLPFLIGFLIFVGRVGFAIRDEIRGKITTGNMSTLHAVLAAGQPDTVEPEVVEALLVQYANANFAVLTDGWGKPIQIGMKMQGEGSAIYTVRSFGRDGKPSSCCEKFVHNEWDKDAVLEGGEWLQVW